MIRLLPFILIPVVLVIGLGWWRYSASKQTLTTSSEEKIEVIEGPVEVPKTLPNATLEERVTVLEETLVKLINSVNAMKAQTSKSQASQSQSSSSNSSSSSTSRSADAAITELKARVSALESATPAPAATSNTSKSVIYIPLGSGGGPWANTDWYSLSEYEISLDPANYPGYTGMVLEVTFRLVEAAGTGSVRLYNVSSSTAASGQLDTTSSSYELKSSSSFTLPSGVKTYRLQIKSSSNKDLYIQSARIKVNF